MSRKVMSGRNYLHYIFFQLTRRALVYSKEEKDEQSCPDTSPSEVCN